MLNNKNNSSKRSALHRSKVTDINYYKPQLKSLPPASWTNHQPWTWTTARPRLEKRLRISFMIMSRRPTPDAGHSNSRERVSVFMISFACVMAATCHVDFDYKADYSNGRPRGSEDFSMPRGPQSSTWQINLPRGREFLHVAQSILAGDSAPTLATRDPTARGRRPRWRMTMTISDDDGGRRTATGSLGRGGRQCHPRRDINIYLAERAFIAAHQALNE